MPTTARAGRTGWLVCLAAGTILAVSAAARGQAASAPSTGGSGGGLNVTSKGKVELHVQGADLRRVLQLLSTQSKTNIVASKEVQGTVTADLYGVTFTQALDAVLRSAGFRYMQQGNFIYVMTDKQYADWVASKRQKAVKVFKLSYVSAATAKDLIAPAMSSDGTVSVTPAAKTGVASSADDAGGDDLAAGDILVVRDYPENLEKVAQIIREVDVRPQQVLIEATILRATLDENNALGIDFNALAGVDFRSLSSSSTGVTSITPGAVPAAQLDKESATFRTDFNSAITSGGLTIGFISNNVSFFIRALETVTDVAVLANPKLLVMNKQRGEVMVGNRDGYITTTVTETTATQTVEFLETGTQLIVRPFVASDGYVRLEIHPEDSTGGLTADQLPYEQTTECTTNVLIKDGHTIVIGGLFRERTNNTRAQVPGLGNIPLLGNIFRRRSDVTEREEVIVLITPHIIRQPVDEVVSESLKDAVQRFRFGMRQGLMWFGRDRLAQRHLRWAREHLAGGDTDKALWDVKMALSLEPRMASALRLKERLTKQAIWAHESRYSAVDNIVQRMVMRRLGQPVDRVIPPGRPAGGAGLDKKVREALGIGQLIEEPLPIGPRRPVRPRPVPTTMPAPTSGPAGRP